MRLQRSNSKRTADKRLCVQHINFSKPVCCSPIDGCAFSQHCDCYHCDVRYLNYKTPIRKDDILTSCVHAGSKFRCTRQAADKAELTEAIHARLARSGTSQD